jgi:Fe-S-cluster containining protein
MPKNPFETALGVPMPSCCSTGDCCKGASPSIPYHALLLKAAQGDDFARGFFSIFVAYPDHQAAHRVVPGLVERTLNAARKSRDKFPNGDADVVFYRCRYHQPDNRCGVWEDRPQFCRDYPDTPFVVMAPGCAFEEWGAACKVKYQALKDELTDLKALRTRLQEAREKGASGLAEAMIDALPLATDNDTQNLTLVLSLTDLYVSAPLTSYLLV